MTNADEKSSIEQGIIATSFAHRGFTIIGASLVVFELMFLVLYTNEFWFSCNLLNWGAPLIVIIVYATHLLFCWLEGPKACQIFLFLLHGKPPVVYRQWLRFDEQGIISGLRRVLWDVIDETNLTLFGTLLLKSRKLSGLSPLFDNDITPAADIVLKLPLHALAVDSQKQFIEILRAKRPSIIENARLTKQISQPFLKAAALVQGLGVVFLAAVLIDFGYSECRLLEILKEYYLCMQACHASATDKGLDCWNRAETIRVHPLPISWISQQIMQKGKLNSVIAQVRSQALWDLGKREEALQAVQEAINSSPKIITYYLRAARLCSDMGNRAEGEEFISKACEQNKDSLLPRLYMLSFFLREEQQQKAEAFYKNYSDHLKDDYFADSPSWPPGNESLILHCFFDQEDMDFLFNPLVSK